MRKKNTSQQSRDSTGNQKGRPREKEDMEGLLKEAKKFMKKKKTAPHGLI